MNSFYCLICLLLWKDTNCWPSAENLEHGSCIIPHCNEYYQTTKKVFYASKIHLRVIIIEIVWYSLMFLGKNISTRGYCTCQILIALMEWWITSQALILLLEFLWNNGYLLFMCRLELFFCSSFRTAIFARVDCVRVMYFLFVTVSVAENKRLIESKQLRKKKSFDGGVDEFPCVYTCIYTWIIYSWEVMCWF